ncbi:MAG: hypothetical protein LBJ93_00090 [Clostridiales bacterium]|nr:hypothetical protein [Clostridiales bacterium]
MYHQVRRFFSQDKDEDYKILLFCGLSSLIMGSALTVVFDINLGFSFLPFNITSVSRFITTVSGPVVIIFGVGFLIAALIESKKIKNKNVSKIEEKSSSSHSETF